VAYWVLCGGDSHCRNSKDFNETKTMATKKINVNSPVKNDSATSGARAPRVSYMEVATALNDEGKLTEVPTDFDTSKHLKPSKDDFAHPALFMEFRAAEAEAKAADLTASAEKYRAEADNLRKFGDPETRKKAKRAAKLREQLADLEAQLAEEGVTVDDE